MATQPNNRVSGRMKKICMAGLLLFTMAGITAGQVQTEPRVYVERSYKNYRKKMDTNPDHRLAELKLLAPNLVYDLRYATRNNFMQRLMYPKNTRTAFLRQPAAEALARVQQELNKEGLGIKIFDAYRPYSVSEKFWKLVKDERYVANPAKGSNHNRGTAVDLTLVDLETGKELNMGTDFDHFTDTAHHAFRHLPTTVLENRQKLKSIMNRFGFTALGTEWWHYTYQSPQEYDVLDIPFRKLES